MEKSQQQELFNRPDAKEIFRDVAGVTLPHHGRPRTLLPEFFEELKRVAGDNLVILHSDATPLDREIASKAKEMGYKIESTESHEARGSDVIVNLFADKSYHQVGSQSTSLSVVVKKTFRDFAVSNDFTLDEVTDAVSKYSDRSKSVTLEPGTVISMPSNAWLGEEIRNQRIGIEQLISRVKSRACY